MTYCKSGSSCCGCYSKSDIAAHAGFLLNILLGPVPFTLCFPRHLGVVCREINYGEPIRDMHGT